MAPPRPGFCVIFIIIDRQILTTIHLVCFLYSRILSIITYSLKALILFAVLCKKGKAIPVQEVEVPRFPDNRNMKVVRLSAVSTGRPYPWYSFLLEAESNPEPYCGRKECQWKIPTTSSEIEPATFEFVAHYLNQLRHRVPSLSWMDVKFSRIVGQTQIKNLESVYNSRPSLMNIQRKTIVVCISAVKTLAYDGLFRINDDYMESSHNYSYFWEHRI
jgi:hypothetical protein